MNVDKTAMAIKLLASIGEISDQYLAEAELARLINPVTTYKRIVRYGTLVAGFSGALALIFILMTSRKKGSVLVSKVASKAKIVNKTKAA